ncbi:MAG: cytochrome P450 [Candidatus Nanopelagicales bacterium]
MSSPAPAPRRDADVPDRRYFRTPATAPGPAGPQMLSAFWQIRRNPLAYLERVWREYGDVVQFPIPSPPSYLVVDPDGVRRVLQANARNYGKRTIQYRSLSLVTGEGLLTADTDAWKRQRRLVQPAFHHESVNRVGDHVAIAGERLLDQWDSLPDGSVVDVDEAMMHAALEVVGRALFGTDLSGDAGRLATATLAALDVVIARARTPVSPPSWLPTPDNRRLAAALRELDGAVTAMLAERGRRTADPSEPDMLDLLLSARDDTGAGLSRSEVRDQVVTFLVAGHETVASALTWSWALLAEHPEQQERLAAEAHEALGGRFPGVADLPALPYARAVFDEALRLYPPAWLITRRSHEADEVGGRSLPAGSLVILSPWLLHRHPDLWDRPEQFAPERFLGDGVDRRGFIPFGAGPRLCIGRDFAYVEGVLLLAAVAARYRVDRVPGTPRPVAEPLVTVRPVAGLPLRLTRRG